MTGSFSLGAFGWASAAGPASTVLAQVDAAVSGGGDAVRTLFATDLTAVRALRSAVSGSWLSGVDSKTGQATRYVAVGDTFLTIGMVPSDSAAEVLQSGATEPATIGFVYLTLLTGADGTTPVVTQLMSGTASYTGDPIPAFTSADGLKSLIGGLIDKATDFVGSMFELAWEAEATDIGAAAQAAADATDSAAGAASGPTTITGPGGVQVQTDVELTTGEAISLGLGIVAVLASLLLDVLAKQLTGYVRVYNATADELDVSLAWLHPGASYAGPTATEFVTLPPVGPVWTPPWIIGEQAASYAGWVVGNTDSLSRVGYVLRIAETDTFPGADVMVDIPNTGANSLTIGIGATEDYSAFWSANEGNDTALTASASGGPYQVRIATNQNSGRSAAPTDGALGYDFEHVVVISPAS